MTTRATPAQVDKWFSGENGARLGLGIACGVASGNLEVLDFDRMDMLKKFVQSCKDNDRGGLIDKLSLWIITPGKGHHLWYRVDGTVAGNTQLAASLIPASEGEKGAKFIDGKWQKPYTLIETRGQGGQALVPPTPAHCHPDNALYILKRGSFDNIPVLTEQERDDLHALARLHNEYIPSTELIDPNRRRKELPAGELRPGDDYDMRGDMDGVLEKNGWSPVRAYGEKKLWRRPGKAKGWSATSNYAGRNLFYAFSTNCEPFQPKKGYTPFQVYAVLEHGEDFKAAAQALAAIGYGSATPRRESALDRQVKKLDKQVASPVSDGSQDASLPSPPAGNTEASEADGEGAKRFNLTDLGNTYRFISRHGDDVRYIQSFDRWYYWDKKVWRRDYSGNVDRMVRDTVRRIPSDAAEIDDKHDRADLLRWAIQSESSARIRAIVELSKAEPPVAILDTDLDADGWLLNCQNGVVDLRTGQIRPHHRSLLMTRIVPTDYDPDAKCPLWLSFLERIMAGDQDVIGFLQRAFGYTLTADLSEQCLFFLHGRGSNGKSTFLTVLDHLMREYGTRIRSDSIMRKHNDNNIPNDIAALFGTRCCTVGEIQEGAKLSEALIKDMTGGDRMTARFLRAEFFTFDPTHKLWIAGNHKPEIRGTDNGIWRRVKFIPFDIQISDAEKDTELPGKLKAEAAGIFAWAIRGCLEWQKNGLRPPEKVVAATSEYRVSMDVVGRFIAECCVTGNAYKVTKAELYTRYKSWCDTANEYAVSKRKLGESLIERSCQSRRGTAGAEYWTGIGLIDEKRDDNLFSDESELSEAKPYSPIDTNLYKNNTETAPPNSLSSPEDRISGTFGENQGGVAPSNKMEMWDLDEL